MTSPHFLTPAQLKLIRALAGGRRATVRDLHEECNPSGAYRTTATRLSRLARVHVLTSSWYNGVLVYRLGPAARPALDELAKAAQQAALLTTQAGRRGQA